VFKFKVNQDMFSFNSSLQTSTIMQEK